VKRSPLTRSGKVGGAPSAAVSVAAAGPAERPLPEKRLALALLWLLVLLPPLYVSTSAKDSFRLPKLMLAEWLALASLVPLVWGLRRVEAVRWGDLWRQPAVRALLPLLAVATLGLLTSDHPHHVRQALADLWIGAACLAGWSAALPEGRLARLLGGLLWPGVALAALGGLQFCGFQPLPLGALPGGARFALTGTAGNPGDLAAFLVLPCLVAEWRLARGPRAPVGTGAGRSHRGGDGAGGRGAGGRGAGGRSGGGSSGGGGGDGGGGGWRRAWLWAALALCAGAMVLTQTFAALAALAAGSLVLWGGAQFRREARGRRAGLAAAAALAALAVLAAGAVAAVPALRARLAQKAAAARQGDWNAVLTGRLDGWRTALWMIRRHPWTGVGQGAYRAEFVPAKLALLDRGVAFHSGQQQNFVNAHDEPLEVGADCGLPGLLALAWAQWVLASAARRRLRGAAGAGGTDGLAPLPARRTEMFAPLPARRVDGAFAAAGLAALGVLCLVDFPFRVALVAFPALLFLAWVLRPVAAEAAG
jgi:uncharacterized membrane protein YgcG